MEILRHLLVIYCFVGILITGGLLFNAKGKAGVFLMIFTLIYSIEGIDFLYQTSSLLEIYPEFFMLGFSMCLAAGPTIWFHLCHLEGKASVSEKTYFFHFFPFIVYTLFTGYLLSYSGLERIDFVQENFISLITPLNYGKVVHVLFYAILLLLMIKKKKNNWPVEQTKYVYILTGIYLLTAFLLTILTTFSTAYTYFIGYFLGASTVVLFAGYMLYFQPVFFQRWQQKYARSGLLEVDKKRIAKKIDTFFSKVENITSTEVNLEALAKQINEKKHHISQTLSDEFSTSFRDIVNQARVNYAKKLLSDPTKDDLKILAIAFESGFKSKSTFNRAFVKYEKCTPNEIRRKNR